MNVSRCIALFLALGAVAGCAMFQPQPQPAPAWLTGHFKGHNVRAPSYPIDMVVDATGHVVVTNATNTAQGQFVKGDLVVWRNGKQQCSVRATDNGVTLTQTDDTSNVEVFQCVR